MRAKNELTKVSESLQEDLADYGLMRAKAIEGAGVSHDDDLKFFGMRKDGSKTSFKFDATMPEIQKSNKEVAVVAPEHEAFDMIATTDFHKIKNKSIDGLRSFLGRLFDEA